MARAFDIHDMDVQATIGQWQALSTRASGHGDLLEREADQRPSHAPRNDISRRSPMSVWTDYEGQEQPTHASDEAHARHGELVSDGRDAAKKMRPAT